MLEDLCNIHLRDGLFIDIALLDLSVTLLDPLDPHSKVLHGLDQGLYAVVLSFVSYQQVQGPRFFLVGLSLPNK